MLFRVDLVFVPILYDPKIDRKHTITLKERVVHANGPSNKNTLNHDKGTVEPIYCALPDTSAPAKYES